MESKEQELRNELYEKMMENPKEFIRRSLIGSICSAIIVKSDGGFDLPPSAFALLDVLSKYLD